LGHRLLFLQDFENDLDLQVGGIVFSDGAHNVLKPPLFFCLDFGVHYIPPELFRRKQSHRGSTHYLKQRTFWST